MKAGEVPRPGLPMCNELSVTRAALCAAVGRQAPVIAQLVERKTVVGLTSHLVVACSIQADRIMKTAMNFIMQRL